MSRFPSRIRLDRASGRAEFLDTRPRIHLVKDFPQLYSILEDALEGRLLPAVPPAEPPVDQDDLTLASLTVEEYGELYSKWADLSDVILWWWLDEKVKKWYNNNREARQSTAREMGRLRGDALQIPVLNDTYFTHFKPLWDTIFDPRLDKHFDRLLDPRPYLAMMAGFTSEDYSQISGPSGMNRSMTATNNAHASSSSNTAMDPAEVHALVLARIRELEIENEGLAVNETVGLAEQMSICGKTKSKEKAQCLCDACLQNVEAAAARQLETSKKEHAEASAAAAMQNDTLTAEQTEITVVAKQPETTTIAQQVDKKTPVEVLVKLIMQATGTQGFKVSREYAERFLYLCDNSIIDAMNAMETDLSQREKALEATGRFANVHFTPESPFTRDEIVRFQEDNDRQMQEYAEKGANSFVNHFIIGTKKHSLALFEAFNLEVAHRHSRAQMYNGLTDLVADGGMSSEDLSETLKGYDMGPMMPTNIASSSGAEASAGYSFDKFVSTHVPAVVTRDNHQRGGEPLGDTRVEGASEKQEAKADVATAPTRTRAELLKGLDEVFDELSDDMVQRRAGKAVEAAVAAVDGVLPDVFPFEERIAGMDQERQAVELARLTDFMGTLKTKAAAEDLIVRRAMGEFETPSAAQRSEMIERAGKTGLVQALLTCGVDELARHKFLMRKHEDITGSIVNDQEWMGSVGEAVAHLREACPQDVKTGVQAMEEVAIAGGSAALAVGFARFRAKYLDRLMGKDRSSYNLGEAKRFAAAVRYGIDLDEEWVGPSA